MREPNLDGPVVIGEPAPITDATVPPEPPPDPGHTAHPVTPPAPVDELAHTGVEVSLLPAVLLIVAGITLLRHSPAS